MSESAGLSGVEAGIARHGWLRELGAAVGGLLGWGLWSAGLSLLMLLLSLSWRLVASLDHRRLITASAIYLITVPLWSAWPLLVGDWPRFACWTWIWGFLGMGLNALLAVASAAHVPGAPSPHFVIMQRALGAPIVAVGCVVGFAVLVIAYRFRRSLSGRTI